MSDNILQLNKELIYNKLKHLVHNSVEENLNALLDYEEINSLMPRNTSNLVKVKDTFRNCSRNFQTTASQIEVA